MRGPSPPLRADTHHHLRRKQLLAPSHHTRWNLGVNLALTPYLIPILFETLFETLTCARMHAPAHAQRTPMHPPPLLARPVGVASRLRSTLDTESYCLIVLACASMVPSQMQLCLGRVREGVQAGSRIAALPRAWQSSMWRQRRDDRPAVLLGPQRHLPGAYMGPIITFLVRHIDGSQRVCLLGRLVMENRSCLPPAPRPALLAVRRTPVCIEHIRRYHRARLTGDRSTAQPTQLRNMGRGPVPAF